MKKLICIACGAAEDLNNPTGNIHPVQLNDLFPLYDELDKPDKSITEDLCGTCRTRLRQTFFGEEDSTLMNMPLMKGA